MTAGRRLASDVVRNADELRDEQEAPRTWWVERKPLERRINDTQDGEPHSPGRSAPSLDPPISIHRLFPHNPDLSNDPGVSTAFASHLVLRSRPCLPLQFLVVFSI